MCRTSTWVSAILLIAIHRPAWGQFDLPEVGSPLPDVTVLDEHGEEWSTQELRGQYTVLVFGCLT